MTKKKPPGISQDAWIERLVREARERGDFDDLPGAGKPIPDLDRPHDELWWLKKMLQREQLSVTPPALALRKALEEALTRIRAARSEARVRALVAEINDQITKANREATAGPATELAPLDVERVVASWRNRPR